MPILTSNIPMFRDSANAIVRFLREEDGPTAIEYAVVLALIVGVCISAVGQLAVATGDSFNSSSDAINDAFTN